MDKTYAIIWTATQSGRWGLGTGRFSKDDAEALVTQLNEEHVGFVHRAIDMANEDPAAVLGAMRSADTSHRGQVVKYPDFVAAEAAAIAATDLLPNLNGKLIWLKPLADASAA